MTISLIVATLGRRRELARLLESLTRQTFSSFRVLIVDQNPPGFLDQSIRPYGEQLDLRLLQTASRGVSVARNVGLEQAEGHIICFPDDDCWYLPHTLERVRDFFAEQPKSGGLVASWSERCPSQARQGNLIRVRGVDAFKRAETFVQFYRHQTVRGLRFDPELGPGTGLPYGSGEDTDFLLQVLNKGVLVQRTSEVLIGHPQAGAVDEKTSRKIEAYARGRMFLLRKHDFPWYVKWLHVVYPLARLPLEGPKAWHYRWLMFWSRFKALWSG